MNGSYTTAPHKVEKGILKALQSHHYGILIQTIVEDML